ncbi:MAG: hypothetical protein JKY20_06805, partial [Alphaproteobacteria bacterium]|nr:hypothetical protein [Alphaproteobacteria bacterium]
RVKKAPVAVKNDTLPVSQSALNTGRVLLRQLEAGQGPSIEIAWPSSRPERDALYRVFVRCYGMTTAILSEDDQLFRVKDPAGRPWRLNRDRYSGFLRQATGQAVYAERQTLAQIRARHGLVAGTPIRLFPRRVDAALLGGLHQITNARFGDGVSIRARYQRSGSTVRVLSLRIGGRAMPGEIVLPSDCGD